VTPVYLDHLGTALGARAQSVEEAALRGLTRSPAAVLRDAGFLRHHVSEGTSAYDLARRAVEAIRPALQDVGAIVYATCLPLNGNAGSEAAFRDTRDVKHLMDFPASRLQADFDLERAAVVGLNQQACTGALGALRIAAALLRDEPALERVLCVTADRFPEGALYEQAYNLISDGAAACVVSLDRGAYRILACHAITNGALSLASDDETAGHFFAYSHRAIHETLGKAGLAMDDIAWVVPQNMNVTAWQIFARLLHFDLARVAFPTLPEAAHVISADNLLNLKRITEEGRVQPGDRVLLVMSGFGLNWQCVILERT
jgi:3-oxoacyl-[acyl-carrier-protein] synthase III